MIKNTWNECINNCEKVEILSNNELIETIICKEDKLSDKPFELIINEKSNLDNFEIRLYDVKEFDYIDYKEHVVDIMSKWQKSNLTKIIKYHKIKKNIDNFSYQYSFFVSYILYKI